MSPCHEADTRMMLPWCHSVQQVHTKAYLRNVASDNVMLAINLFGNIGLSELWIRFGVAKTYKYIPIHHITQMFGPQRCEACIHMV